MTALLRLIVLVPLAWLMAVVAAALLLTFGVFGWQVDSDTVGYAAGAAIGFTLFGATTSFLPSLLVIVLAEIFRWRALLFYVAAGGVIGFLSREFTDVWHGLQFPEASLALFITCGFLGGFVYWLLAGRDAGFTQPVDDRPPPGTNY